MNEQPIRFAVVRDRTSWDSAQWVGLEPHADGALTLARVPGTMDGKPFVVTGAWESSGMAAGECEDLYLADTAQQRVVHVDILRDARGTGGGGRAPGQFQSPLGLLVAHDSLYVADSANGRVQIFRLPSLELHAIWEGSLQEPIGLAADSQGGIYVLDRGINGVRRFNRRGVLDEGYAVAINSPVSLAIDARDRLYVSDGQSNQISRFDDAGQSLDTIAGPAAMQPRAMAAHGDRLYVADEASGAIRIFDVVAGEFLGALPDYRGPVSALAVDQSGTLYIKPALDDDYYVLKADMAFVASGYVTAGPFDAGIGSVWERAHVDVDLPTGTDATLRVFTGTTDTAIPNWNSPETLAYSLDTLVAAVGAPTSPDPQRYLWVRVELHGDDRRRASPLLKQVQAETTAPSYMSHLPAVYRRSDAPDHFLERWLALFRAQLGDLELALADMPRRFDPMTAPDDQLSWLAGWLAFEPPLDLTGDQLRDLLTRVHALYERRGTPIGLRDIVEMYTGVRPAIFEAFRERHIWQLGYTSLLGFDTALAAGLPDGMIVPGHTLADPSYQGLRGDYYSGIDFAQFKVSHANPPDRQIDFEWKAGQPDDPQVPADYFSVRWTGQVLPRYSERYTFHTLSDDGVRLWVDGLLIIDSWIDQSATEHSGTIELEAGRWVTIQLEYYERTGDATIKLYWSSRSQSKEIIPSSQLYSVRDEGARFELPERAQTMLVGQTVVGESGPLDKADFGMPLFSETAHLFTVSLPAAALPRPEQRELLQRIVEAEKPAHTDYHLCFVEPQMRVGLQARLGIDSIVAGPPAPLELESAILGLESTLAGGQEQSEPGRVGRTTRLGQDSRIG